MTIMLNRRRVIGGLAFTMATGGLLRASPALAGILQDGAVVSFECLGSVRTNAIWLDGNTVRGTVGLAPSRDGGYTGTFWRVQQIDEQSIALRCEGHIEGPRWLDGNTVRGTTGLVQSTQGFSGARWEVVAFDEAQPDIVALQCLGDIDGPRWLDGRTRNATVGLVYDANTNSGARWRIVT